MIDRQVEGPQQAVLERIMAYVGGLGSGSEPMLAALAADQGPCGLSWVRIRAHVGGPGPLSGHLGRSWAALGAYVGCLGAYVGGLGLLLGPM